MSPPEEYTMTENQAFPDGDESSAVESFIVFNEDRASSVIDLLSNDSTALDFANTTLDWSSNLFLMPTPFDTNLAPLDAPIPSSASFFDAARTETAAVKAPVIRGVNAAQTTTQTEDLHPFATVTISDPNPGAIETLTIHTGNDQYDVGFGHFYSPYFESGTYTLIGTAATVTRELRSVVFIPPPAAAEPAISSYSFTDLSSADSTPSDSGDIVIVDTTIRPDMSVSNPTGDWIELPFTLRKYWADYGVGQLPQLDAIYPFQSDGGKTTDILVTWFFYGQKISCPAEVLQYNAKTKSFVDATSQFFPGGAPEVMSPTVAVGDLNGDGNPDFFFADLGVDGQPISAPDELYLSTSKGTYVKVKLPSSAQAAYLASEGVIDRQGDIAVITDYSSQYQGADRRSPFLYLIFKNNGTFTNLSTTDEPTYLNYEWGVTARPYLIDVNGDGLADLLYCPEKPGPYRPGDTNSTRLELFINPGDGDFASVKPILLPRLPFGDGPNAGGQIYPPDILDIKAFKDAYGHGDDLVVISETPSEEGYGIQILMNDGAGHFTDETATRLIGAPSVVSSHSHNLNHVFIADLNNNGPDIVTSGSGGSPSQVFLNNGNDVFTLAFSLGSLHSNQPTYDDAPLVISGVEKIGGIPTLILTGNTGELLFVPYDPPPELRHQTENRIVAAGDAFSFSLASDTFLDPNGLKMTYHASGKDFTGMPKWLSFDDNTMTFSGSAPTAAGSYDIMVTAFDPHGWLAEDSFKITVAASRT